MTDHDLQTDSSRTPSEGNLWAVSAWCVIAAFGTYFCMYFFRKPFAASKYEGLALGGTDYKTVLVIAQVMGYTLSKFFGIKVIAELKPQRRIAGIILLIAIAEAASWGSRSRRRPTALFFSSSTAFPWGWFSAWCWRSWKAAA